MLKQNLQKQNLLKQILQTQSLLKQILETQSWRHGWNIYFEGSVENR